MSTLLHTLAVGAVTMAAMLGAGICLAYAHAGPDRSEVLSAFVPCAKTTAALVRVWRGASLGSGT